LPNVTVGSGDCISSIAASHGLYWETVWNHPQNSALKHKRKDPGILFPGDAVFVPDVQPKTESRSSGHNYKFVKKSSDVMLRLRLMNEFHARGGVKYSLKVGNLVLNGSTDGGGYLEKRIPVFATQAVLTTKEDSYELAIGSLAPIEENIGVQHRLQNLGYLSDEATGLLNDVTTAAITKFQKEHGLTADGNLTDGTRNKLKELHGC
jgi:putative peptidoglycan binding protein